MTRLGSQEAGYDLNKSREQLLWSNLLYSTAPTVTPYPVASSLVLRYNFIFFLEGSNEDLDAVREEKERHQGWGIPCLQGCGPWGWSWRAVRGVNMVGSGEVGKVGSGYLCGSEEVT